ncbi:type II toxin-antitoxin system Phd/YefM family antitoxin [Burkholderia sp. Ac-20379]|uniref:type II toxin-antitoxin system Phd/YefM family antitoxin n=1 Tax=Burkholderia sp. Ac-20379 TaxID=2703900 RepID=UPI00403F11EF
MLERFLEHSPIAIMARLMMQCAVDDQWLDAGDDPQAALDHEPLREALLARVAEAMIAIGAGAASFAMSPEFAPAVTALHDRMSRLRSGWGRALVKDGTALLLPLAPRLPAEWADAAGGLRLRVLDGTALPAGLACRPGHDGCRFGIDADEPGGPCALPVYDPESGLVVDLVPYERGRVNERAFAGALLESLQPGELWILDGRFGTAGMLSCWPRGSGWFLLREHGCEPAWQAAGEAIDAGLLDGGRLTERPVTMAGDTGAAYRCIEWQPFDAASEPLRVLTNAPVAWLDTARAVRLARERWRAALPLPADAMFDGALYADLPVRALPLALGIVATAWNVCSVMTTAATGELDLEARDAARLPAQIAASMRSAYAGMMIALPPAWWRRYDHLSIGTLGSLAKLLAHHVDPRSDRRKRRDHSLSAKSRAQLRAATLDRLLHDEHDGLTSNVFSLRTVAMATRDFSSNPSKALRHAGEALVMVTKYNRPIALLVSIEDWNRLLGEVRETSVSRLSLDGGGPVQRVPSAGTLGYGGDVPLN